MNRNNLVPGTIKGIQIVDLEKKFHNKSLSKHYAIKLKKPKNSSYFNNSINNDSSLITPKENISNKNTSISSKTKPQNHSSISSNQNNNKNLKIKGQIITKNNKRNLLKVKSNPKNNNNNNNNLPKPSNQSQKEIIVYKEKKIGKKTLSNSKNKKPNTQSSIIRNNNSNQSKKEKNVIRKLKSEPNIKKCCFYNDFYRKNIENGNNIINHNKNNINEREQKSKIKNFFKRILTVNTDMEQISFIKSSLPTSNFELNSSQDSINYNEKKFDIKNKTKNIKRSIHKSMTNNKAYIVSKEKDKNSKGKIKNNQINKIIKKNINYKNYNSNKIKDNNNNINYNNYLFTKENINYHKLNNSNSLGEINNNHKKYNIRNMSNIKKNNNNNNSILNGTAIYGKNKMNCTFNNNIHKLNSSSKSKNKSNIKENKILISNKRYKINQKNKLNNYIKNSNKIFNKKESENLNKSPNKNSQINIIMIQSNSKNNNNNNNNINSNIITASNYNKNKDKDKEYIKDKINSSTTNSKIEMIKKIKINNYKNISSHKKKKISNYGNNGNGNIHNQSMKGNDNSNINRYKIIKKIKNNINDSNSHINDNNRILNLKNNVKVKTYNKLNETNNNNNSNPHLTFIKKSSSNQNYLDMVSPKININNIDMSKINKSKMLTSNNSCENLSFNKIVNIQKSKENSNNSKQYDIINNENIEINSKSQKNKKIEPYNSKNSSTNINKSFNIGKNIYYNNITSSNSNNKNINNNNNNNNNNILNSNNEIINKTLIYEKEKKPKKIISISCSIKNQKKTKIKIKVHRRKPQSMINQGTNNNQNKKNIYQNINNNLIKNINKYINNNVNNANSNISSLKNKFKPQTINIDLQNDSYLKYKNKIKNSAKKFFNKEEPMSAKKIILKYKKYLKEIEIEELKKIFKKGELVYYLGEIFERINNKENTFSKINKSFIIANNKKNNVNENILLKLSTKKIEEEKIIINRSCNNFGKGNDEKLKKIKNKFDPNKFNDEEGDYILNKGYHLNYRYEILGCLGKGSFGEAVKCYDHKNKDLVCVKIINSQKKFQNQALTEIKILSAISTYDINNDSNNVKFYNYFIFRNHICLVFELLGKNLYEYLQLNNFIGLEIAQIKNYAVQILFSLLFLRNINVIHCDLKPENILIFPNNPNQIKVIDFGSSCFETERIYLYIQSRFYRAPEVLLDLGYNYEIDMWSLGCILYELYTGTPLFPGINEMEQIYLIMEKIGAPPIFYIENSPKGRIFFDINLKPFLMNDEEGNIIKPGGKKIKDILKDAPDSFIDFINKLLLWNPFERLTPDKALLHPFIIENMNSMELYKHKLKVKHMKYGMKNYNGYNISSTRNKDYYYFNYHKEIMKNRGNSCETNRNSNKLPFKINNKIIYTNPVCVENDEIKKNNVQNYSVTHGNNRYYNYNFYGKQKKDKNLPLSIDIELNLRRINTTEDNENGYRKISKYKKNKKKLPKHLPKKKSFGRVKKNNNKPFKKLYK